MLFRHEERDIDFTLVVDDFGVKYKLDADWDHLCAHLHLLYDIKPHPVGTQFLDFSIHHDRTARTLSMSYPGYIQKLLARVRPHGVFPTDSPAVPHDVVYVSKGPQISRTDTTPTASIAQTKELQVGSGFHFILCPCCRPAYARGGFISVQPPVSPDCFGYG